MCSVEFTLLEWDWDMQLSGHTCNSREERSPNTGLKSSLPVFFFFFFFSTLCQGKAIWPITKPRQRKN